MYMTSDYVSEKTSLRYTPSTLSQMIPWSRIGRFLPIICEDRNILQQNMKNLSSQEMQEKWLEQCQQTYHKKLPVLQKEHPGEYVAIDGNNIKGYAEESILLFEKSKTGILPVNIEVFYIPKEKEDENKITAKNWVIKCEKTYKRTLSSLIKEHPGEFVAINGDYIDRIMNDLSEMTNYYFSPNKNPDIPFVRIYDIPSK